MLSTVNHKRNANKRQNKIPLHTSRMIIIKKNDNTRCLQGCGETGTLFYAGNNLKRYSHFGEKFGNFMKS